MACYSTHSSEIALFGMGQDDAFFDRYGQAFVVLVHVFLRREIRHALLTGVLSDVDEFCRDTDTTKVCHALHIRPIEDMSSRSDREMP